MGQSGSKLTKEQRQFKDALCKFQDVEIEMLEETFKDLAARSHGHTIDKLTFQRVFELPGMLGERLFDVFDQKHNGVIDWQEFVCGLGWFVRGDVDEKIRFMFSMYDLAGDNVISRSEMETMLNSVVFAAATIYDEAIGAEISVVSVDSDASRSRSRAAEQQRNLADTSDQSSEHFPTATAAPAPTTPSRESFAGDERSRQMNVVIKELINDAFDAESVDDKLTYTQFKRWVDRHPEALAVINNAFAMSSHVAGTPRSVALKPDSNIRSPPNGSDFGQSGKPNSGRRRGWRPPQIDPNAESSHKQHLSVFDVLSPHSPGASSRGAPGKPLSNFGSFGRVGDIHNNSDTDDEHQLFGVRSPAGRRPVLPAATILPRTLNSDEDDDDGDDMPGVPHAERECRSCGWQVNIVHCYNCGLRLMEDNECPTCGKVFVAYDISFCINCGFDLSLDKVEPPLVKTASWTQHLKHVMHEKEGELFKVGQMFHAIKPRYFSIQGQVLYEFHNKGDLRPTRILFLNGVYCEPVNHRRQNAKLEFGLEIITNEEPRRSRVLYAKTEAERNSWVEAINLHANVHDVNDFYVIGDVVGVGRFSTVRVATRKSDGKEYAVKVIDKASMTHEEREHLRKEIAVMKLVYHPNIISLRNIFETRTQMHIIMTLASGGDLMTLVSQRERLPEDLARQVTRSILHAVHYLHERGVVHRDLKPENIFVASRSDPSKVVLGDFGFSTFTTPKMLMHAAVGTLNYLAPEILEMEGYGKSVDCWSIGVILYFIVSGTLPFHSEVREDVMDSISSGQYSIKGPLWDTLSDEVKDLIKHLLVVDPHKRLGVDGALNHPWFTRHGMHSVESHLEVSEQPLSEAIANVADADPLSRPASRMSDLHDEERGSADCESQSAPSIHIGGGTPDSLSDSTAPGGTLDLSKVDEEQADDMIE